MDGYFGLFMQTGEPVFYTASRQETACGTADTAAADKLAAAQTQQAT